MVYVTGDMHGDEDRLYTKEFKRLKAGDTLIVAGDFGFVWNNSKSEKRLLKYLGSRKFHICFVDGPNDNLNIINKCRETVWKGGRVHRISRNLFHLCRGQIFNIDGISIFTFGGGESSDKDLRGEQEKWWKDCLPNLQEMTEGAENIDNADCNVDVIITHEPPSLVKSGMLLRAGKEDNVSMLNGYLEELNRTCKFKKWYFGWAHEDRMVTPVHTAVFQKILPISLERQQSVMPKTL